MTKVCKKHAKEPAMIYGQCIGCELESYQDRIRKLEDENKKLKLQIEGFAHSAINRPNPLNEVEAVSDFMLRAIGSEAVEGYRKGEYTCGSL